MISYIRNCRCFLRHFLEKLKKLFTVEDIEYDLVEDAEEDSDYKSDFDSEEEDSNDIFDKIAKY